VRAASKRLARNDARSLVLAISCGYKIIRRRGGIRERRAALGGQRAYDAEVIRKEE